MLRKHYINGKEKPRIEQEKFCETCLDGAIFEDDIKKYQKFEGNSHSFICIGCDSKYIVPLIPHKRLIDNNCDECSFCDGEKCNNNVANFLCIGNIDAIENTIQTKEVTKMDMEYLLKQNEFESTGICKHYWKPTEPFKTFEGRFVLNVCRVCNMSTVQLDGITYSLPLPRMVNWLAHRGIEKEKINKKTMKTFESLGHIKEEPEINVDNLFDTTPKTPDLDFVDYDKPTLPAVPELNFV